MRSVCSYIIWPLLKFYYILFLKSTLKYTWIRIMFFCVCQRYLNCTEEFWTTHAILLHTEAKCGLRDVNWFQNSFFLFNNTFLRFDPIPKFTFESIKCLPVCLISYLKSNQITSEQWGSVKSIEELRDCQLFLVIWPKYDLLKIYFNLQSIHFVVFFHILNLCMQNPSGIM